MSLIGLAVVTKEAHRGVSAADYLARRRTRDIWRAPAEGRRAIVSNEIQYYQQRIIVERTRANNSPSPAIASAHEMLASLYEEFIRSLQLTEETSNVVDLLPPQDSPQAQSGTVSR